MTSSPVNTTLWLDIPVTDLDRAITFYQAILNIPARYRQGKVPTAAFQFSSQGSGLTLIPVKHRPSPSGILPYLNCHARLAQALSQVTINGGKIEQDRQAMEPFGVRAIIIDSEGNRLALHSAQ